MTPEPTDVGELLRRAIANRNDVALDEGGRYLYRPHQFLVDREHEADVVDLLRGVGAFRRRRNSREGRYLEKLGVHCYRMVADGDAATGMARMHDGGLQDRVPAEAVRLNHVLGGAPVWRFGPGDEPTEGGPEPVDTEPNRFGGTGKGVRVAILDTGFVAASAAAHPLLSRDYVDDGDDVDALYDPVNKRILSIFGGHGTFIAGIIRKVAPDTQLDPEVTLDDAGLVDDLELATDLLRTRGAHIVNLSLAAPTEGDRPPPALARALRELGQRTETVYVAAAGNDYREVHDTNPHQKMWPAAFGAMPGYEHVVGVAAVDRDGQPAGFSNRGPWVRACAYGVRERSTYVEGELSLPSGPVTFADPTAYWSGTSFAAPRVAAAIAAAMTGSTSGLTARGALDQVLASAPPGPPDCGQLVG